MVRSASYDRNGMKKGAWSEEEDNKLKACINRFGHPNWRMLPLVAGLKRCGKSCRLRWVNYLKPGIRRGNFTKDEEAHIIQLHKQLGNKWSAIAAYFDGRTDNDIKNYWHAHIQKRRNNRAKNIQNLQLNQDIRPASEGVAENMGAFELNADSDYNINAAAAAAYHLEEELYGVGLWKEDIMSILFDYSDACGIASWNLGAAESQPEPLGEDFFNIQLWR